MTFVLKIFMTKSQAETRLEEEGRRIDLKYVLDRLDDQIHMELELIGHRMNVLVVSQAFLFAAFTTDLLAESDKFAKIEDALLWVIPAVAALVCVMISVSLVVAIVVIRHRKKERDEVRNKLREAMQATTLHGVTFGNNVQILEHVSDGDLAHGLGNYPPLILPPVILIFWFYLFHIMGTPR